MSDGEPPTVVNLPANQSFDIDFPATTRVAAWSEPTVRDNVPGATITQIAGPRSGSAFPVGVTTVTYEARDVAGNVTRASFTVTVKAIPPGSVSFIFQSQDGGRYGITSPEPTLNASIDAKAGINTIAPIQIRPGTYPIAFSVPDGVGVASVGCSGIGTALDLKTKSGQVQVFSGQSAVCTIITVASQRVTAETVATLLEARQALILANQPSSDRRIGRLQGRSSASSGNLNLGGFSFASRSPLSLNIGNDGRMSFSFARPSNSLSGLGIGQSAQSGTQDRLPGQGGSGVELWAEGSLAKIDVGNGDGKFGILHFGADFLATKDLLLGAALQLDSIDLKTSNSATSKGNGFMLGPYATARLSENLFVDAKFMTGSASNKVSPFGTYVDSFDSSRTLLTAAVIGQIESGSFTIRPEARLNWFVEESDRYKDQLGVDIPSIRSATGTLDLGPDFLWSVKGESFGDVELSVGIAGIWAFDQSLQTTAGIQTTRQLLPEFRGRAKSSALFTLTNGVAVSTNLFVDGIGDSTYRSWGGSVGVRLGF